MSRTISAIFDAGLFRLLKPIQLADGTKVELQLQIPSASNRDDQNEETSRAWSAFIDRMESLPDNSPSDGLSNRDHDRIVYGG